MLMKLGKAAREPAGVSVKSVYKKKKKRKRQTFCLVIAGNRPIINLFIHHCNNTTCLPKEKAFWVTTILN